jgi:hypothetical protein
MVRFYQLRHIGYGTYLLEKILNFLLSIVRLSYCGTSFILAADFFGHDSRKIVKYSKQHICQENTVEGGLSTASEILVGETGG